MGEEFFISFVLDKCAIFSISLCQGDLALSGQPIPSLRYFSFLKIPSAPLNLSFRQQPRSSILVLSIICIITIRLKQLTSIWEASRMCQPEVMACSESSHLLGLMPTMKAGRGALSGSATS